MTEASRPGRIDSAEREGEFGFSLDQPQRRPIVRQPLELRHQVRPILRRQVGESVDPIAVCRREPLGGGFGPIPWEPLQDGAGDSSADCLATDSIGFATGTEVVRAAFSWVGLSAGKTDQRTIQVTTAANAMDRKSVVLGIASNCLITNKRFK